MTGLGDAAQPGDERRPGLTPSSCSLCKPPPIRPPRPRRPTTSPRSAEDVIAPLSGTKDISVPVHSVEPYLGSKTDWLVSAGYAYDLRKRGWVYLRCDEWLATRVRAVGMRWRVQPPVRTGEDPSGVEVGPRLVLEVDPATWEPFDQPLGDDAERMRQDYRYHLTDREGVVRHLIAGAPLPKGD